jgi:hypothetical protein
VYFHPKRNLRWRWFNCSRYLSLDLGKIYIYWYKLKKFNP